ncbi:ATP-binding cassette domain-containing protein [Streptomyces diastatochromogenes]|nr:ATP-binding cassette domain-containing protein [Streptomyces diastatochromogenes]
MRDLRISFPSEAGPVEAVRGIGFDLLPGRTLGIVGESGSGKSATAMGIMGLLPPTARVSGEVLLGGRDLVGLDDTRLSAIRGKDIGMVFQDPLSALTPIYSVGRLLSDALRVHQDLTKQAAWNRAVELLDLVGIPEPHRRARSFPHEFSGGMRQRVVIALAMANAPSVIVADEPTTALDVTVQAQILDVLRTAQAETGAGLVLITHDLGVVAGYADDVAVMYAGRIVERAGAEELFRRPTMPYTIGLLGAVPRPDAPKGRPLVPIGGEPPSLVALPAGCPFAERCPAALDRCRTEEPVAVPVAGHGDVACLRAEEIADGRLEAAALFPAPEAPEIPEAPEDTAPGEVVLRVSGLSKTFPSPRARSSSAASAPCTRSATSGSTCGPARPWVWWASPAAARPPRSWRSCGSGRRRAAGSRSTARTSPTPARRRGCGSSAARCRSSCRTRWGPRPPLPVFQLLAEPLRAAGADRAAVRDRVAELLGMVGLDASAADRFPRSSPADSASASASPAPWRPGPGSWSWTSRSRPWTCPCRRASSTCSPASSANSAWRTWSSRTTWP